MTMSDDRPLSATQFADAVEEIVDRLDAGTVDDPRMVKVCYSNQLVAIRHGHREPLPPSEFARTVCHIAGVPEDAFDAVAHAYFDSLATEWITNDS